MSYTFNMYGLSALIKDMRKHNQDLDSFEFFFGIKACGFCIKANIFHYSSIFGIKITSFFSWLKSAQCYHFIKCKIPQQVNIQNFTFFNTLSFYHM